MAERDDTVREMSQARYARAIERRWSALLEEPVVFSRRDWIRIDHWYELRIPLKLIEEAMQEAVERDRSRGRTRRLSELATAVEQAWEVIVQGRRSTEPALPRGEVAAEPLARWRARLAAVGSDSELGRLLRDLLERHALGATPEELDRELARCLRAAVPPSLAAAIESEIAEELEPFRQRLAEARYETTRRRAIEQRLRRRLDLPRLAEHGDPA